METALVVYLIGTVIWGIFCVVERIKKPMPTKLDDLVGTFVMHGPMWFVEIFYFFRNKK